MIDRERLQASLDGLKQATALLNQLSATSLLQLFFKNLFATPSADRLAQFRTTLLQFAPGDQASRDAVAALANTIAGTDIALGTDQIIALKDFLESDYFSPINPVAHDMDDKLQIFYNNLFQEADLQNLRDLQGLVGTYWDHGAGYDAVTNKLASVYNGIAWDARQVFSFVVLLTLDFTKKSLMPYESSGSVW